MIRVDFSCNDFLEFRSYTNLTSVISLVLRVVSLSQCSCIVYSVGRVRVAVTLFVSRLSTEQHGEIYKTAHRPFIAQSCRAYRCLFIRRNFQKQCLSRYIPPTFFTGIWQCKISDKKYAWSDPEGMAVISRHLPYLLVHQPVPVSAV